MPDDFEKVDASFEVRRVPDVLTPTQQASQNPPEQGAGFYEIGAVVGGVFVPFHIRKAAGLDADIERAKAAQENEQQAQQAQPAQPGYTSTPQTTATQPTQPPQ